MQCISVDFPDPDGPITAVKRARSNSTLTLSSAMAIASPLPYVFVKSTARAANRTDPCAIAAVCPLEVDGACLNTLGA